jgi:hypothetical protein
LARPPPQDVPGFFIRQHVPLSAGLEDDLVGQSDLNGQDTGIEVRFAQTWVGHLQALLPCPPQHDDPAFRRRVRVPLALGLHDGPCARIDFDGKTTDFGILFLPAEGLFAEAADAQGVLMLEGVEVEREGNGEAE